MTNQQWADDDALLAALGEAVRAAKAVPPEFTAAGQAAFTWRTIDAELAALTFDSATAEPAVAAVRAEEASPRFLTFAGSDLTIELEIGSDSIVGQVVPAGSGHVDACPASGPAMTAGDRRDRLLRHPAAAAVAVPAALPPGCGRQRADHLDHAVAATPPAWPGFWRGPARQNSPQRKPGPRALSARGPAQC